GDVQRQLPCRTIEMIEALAGRRAGARRHYLAHRRQPIDEQIDVVRPWLERASRVERCVQARRSLWIARAQGLDGRIELTAVVDRDPLTVAPRNQRLRRVAETEDLNLR